MKTFCGVPGVLATILIMDTSWRKSRQYWAYVGLSLVVIALTAILLPSSSAYFRPYFGSVNPLLVAIVAIVAGGASLGLLKSRGWFEILKGRASLRGMVLSAGLATVLGAAIIIADCFIRYPENINVPPPEALLFYPAIGFVAEIVFHVVPLTLLMLGLAPLEKRLGADRVIWLCIVLVAVLEPTFQVMFMGDPLSWSAAYTWIHVCAIALLQLYVFRHYDFVTMYAFRLFYYGYWHIAWGVIRLKVLF